MPLYSGDFAPKHPEQNRLGRLHATPMFLTADCAHNLAEMPLAIKLTNPSAADFGCILTADILGPHPDRLVRDNDATFCL